MSELKLPSVGEKAPDFSALDQNGSVHTLADFKGSFLLLYFYPKDDTPGCTKEACNFRDAFADLKKFGVAIIGVSVDSVKSHKKFAEKYHLTFPLLADEDKSIVHAYGVWGKRTFAGISYEGIARTSFLIDGKGVIRKVYEKVKPNEHAGEILKDVKELQS